MKLENLIDFARKCGLSEKRIEALVAEVCPDENGVLSFEEASMLLKDIAFWTLANEYPYNTDQTTATNHENEQENRRL